MSEPYQLAKKNHEPYFDTALAACLNGDVVLGTNLNENERITIVWHILDRLKSEGWIDETTPHA